MDVILHIGAHRTATTTFQRYVQDQAEGLAGQGVHYWGPQHARETVFPGLFRNSAAKLGRNVARRAEGRVRMFTLQAQQSCVQQLLISDENLMGTCIQNLIAERLYPAAGERTARVAASFGGRLRRIVLSIRSQDLWWASACALTVARGHPVPSMAKRDAISLDTRTWRDVITDISCAAPDAEIEVLPFETCAGRPDRVLTTALAKGAAPDASHRWLNRSKDLRSLRAVLAEQGQDPDILPDADGRWHPFTDEQSARLRENYADDLHWLIAGADGLATLTQDRDPSRADTSLPMGSMKKGQDYDQGQRERYVAQDG